MVREPPPTIYHRTEGKAMLEIILSAVSVALNIAVIVILIRRWKD
nr:MAG TPA: hypothetical protein [Caudoviricetes sp.]